MQRCPTCNHWWLPRPRWFQLWLWPAYWTRCVYLDFHYGIRTPVMMTEDDFIAELLRR